MKDSEFIELLNLYLDHEISPADAARLEAEVLKSPGRRKVYQDYCRMQKACKVLAQDFVEESAPVPEKSAFARSQRASQIGWVATGMFAAVAACLAVVFVNMKHDSSAISPRADIVREVPVAIPTSAVATSTPRLLPRSVTVTPTHDDAVTANGPALTLAGNQDPVSTPERFVSSADRTAPEFAWMNAVELAPLKRASLDDFRYDNHGRAETRPYAKRPAGLPPTEWTAIRWEKR